jgi:putative phosphoesterase
MIKKILIVSDSHGRSQNIKTAIDREQPDMLIHLGDIEDEPEKIRRWLDIAALKKREQSNDEAETPSGLPVPAVFIKGNCDRSDGSGVLKNAAVFEVNSHRFLAVHGHKQGVSYGVENLMYTAMENECDIALYGHTHMPFDESFEGYGDVPQTGVRILNPGSITIPRGGNRKSYMVMTFDDEDEYEVLLKTL